MMLDDVKQALKHVRRLVKVRDYETAHSSLDGLYVEVLKNIATGQCKDFPPEDFAQEALKGEKINFDRWCA